MPEDNIPTNPEESNEETPKFIFRDWEDAPTEESKSSIYADWESDEPPPADIDISELLNFDDKNKRTAYDEWAEVASNPLKLVPWIGSSIIVEEIRKAENIVFNLENAPDSVSQEDVDFLVHWIKTNNTDSTNWAKMWDIVFEIPGLAGELGIGKVATKGGTYLIKRVMKKEFKEKIAKIYQKKVKNEFARKAIEKTGTATSVGLITSYNPLPNLTDELAYRKMMPGLVLGPDDSIILTDYGMDEKKAWKQARLEAFFESSIETLGGSLVKGSGLVVKGITSKVPGVTKGVEAFKKMILSQTDEVTKNNVILTAIYRQMKKLNPYATEGDVRKILNAFGHDGIMGEMLEERFVEGALGITKYLDDKGVLKDFDNPEYDWKLPTFEQLMIEFGAFSIPMAGANIVNTSYDWATTDEAWWDSDIRKQLTEEREKGNFDSEVIDVAERLAKNDPKAFEDKTAINFIDEVREVSREQLRQEGKSEEEIDAFFKGEGLDPIKVGEETISVLGSTLEDNGKVIINLYKGAKADTVVEEFFGSAKRRLSEENLTIWNNYYNEYVINGGTLTSQELFEKEGKKYYFEQGLYADKPIQVVFRKIKQAFDTIFNIQRDKLPDDVRNMYEEAGLGTIGTGTVKGEAVDESFQLSPQKLSKLDATLRELTEEGKSAKMWYEESGQALLDLVDGDYEKARKLLSIIAITSPQMDVKANFGQMIKANYKYVQGATPEAGRFPQAMAKRIKDVMEGKDFGGIKTNSFLDNLLAQLEEVERKPEDRPVTVDMWMMRVFGYEKDVPTNAEYKQIRSVIQDIADELGWEPHQVQASMWTSAKARWESEFEAEMKKARDSGAYKNKKWRSKTAYSKFRQTMFNVLKNNPLSKENISKETFTYANALDSYRGIISVETISDVIFGDYSNVSYEQRLEYDQEIRKILVDENGKDKIAKLIGLFQAGKFNAPGFWEGDTSPSEHLEILFSTTDKFINKESKDLLELYGAIYGLLTNQWAVGATKIFESSSKIKANVIVAETDADIPFKEIHNQLYALGYNTGATPFEGGFQIVRYGSLEGDIGFLKSEIKKNKKNPDKLKELKKELKILEAKQDKFLFERDKNGKIIKKKNIEFQNTVKEILNNLFENSDKGITISRYQSDGILIENNWEENENGESYRQRIRESNRQSIIEDFVDSTSNEIQKVNDKYREKWSKEEVTPQDTKESFQLEPTGRKTLYHTTLTKNLPSILKDGLRPYNTTLWVNPDGERQGSGEIYVFESLEDAKRWKLKMEFEFAENFGGISVPPSVSILEINNTNDSWEEDIDASTGIPKSIMGPDNGKWYRRYEPVEAKDIKRLTDEDIENLSDTKESFQLSPKLNEELKDTKARDENGELITLYHGTMAPPMNKFDKKFLGTGSGTKNQGLSFSTNPIVADTYSEMYGFRRDYLAPRVIPVYLNVKNIAVYDAEGKNWDEASWWSGYKYAKIHQIQEYHKEGTSFRDDRRWNDDNVSDNAMIEFPKVDAIVFKNINELGDGASENIGDTWIVFDPKNIISKTTGENLGKDTKESFQLDSDSVNTSDIEIPEENLRQWLSRKFVDSLSRLKFVERKFGFKEDDWSPSKALENFVGTGSSLMEEFEDLIHKGKNSFVKRLSNAGFTIEQIGEYLYAKHSIERNEEIKRRTGKENGSGMSNEEAEKIINNYKGSGIHKFALEFYRTVTKPALKMRLDKGIITKEQYDTLTKTYKFYVPLKGLLDSEDGYSYTVGKGFSVTTTGIFGARGRESMAGNPFIQAIIDYQSAIMLTEKNKAMVEVYNFLKENEGKGWKISGRKHRAGVDENGDIFFYPEDLKDNEVQVFIDGQRQVITITDKALLNSLKKLGSGRVFKVFRMYSNFFRMINTSLNPEFLLSNFERDLQSALINISADNKKIKSKVLKSIPSAMKGIYNAIRGDGSSEWGKLYNEYKLNGGKVGWWDFKTIDEKTEEFQNEINKLEKKGDAKAILTATLDFIMDCNEVVENAVRLATYKALKDGGLSEERSAHYSKDLTVNFNRKGEYSHILNTIYIFSNAGIQGSFRLFRAVWKDGKPNPRGMKIMGGLTVAGFIQSYVNRLIDDDDWENVDPWIKDNNWNILIPGDKTLSIKLPWGSNVFVALGGLIEQTIAGEITVGEAGSRFVKASADAFNPMGSTPTLSQGLSPTITDPWIQLGENKNFAGWEIRKDQPKFGPKKPDSQLYFKSVRPLTKDATTWLNKITGGSEVESGYVDVNPENLDHLIDSYTGGVGRFIANSINTTKTLFSDTPKEIKNIPFVRQHIKEIDKSKKPRNKFYKMHEESGRKLFTKKQQDEFEDLAEIVVSQIEADTTLNDDEKYRKFNSIKRKYTEFYKGQETIEESRKK